MNDLIKTLKEADVSVLWALVSDLSQIMESRQYRLEWSEKPFVFWYELYKLIEAEIDKRLIADDTEG